MGVRGFGNIRGDAAGSRLVRRRSDGTAVVTEVVAVAEEGEGGRPVS